ncbi:MAG: helix-turn-helix domain-containing protein [Magnetococcus sp. YQC-9]
MGINFRLKNTLSAKGFDHKEFSSKLNEICGIPKSTAYNYLSGVRTPDAENLALLCSRLGINLNWLLTGEGPMFRSSTSPTLSPDESALLDAYRAADEAGRAALLITAKAMARKP